MPQYRNLPTAFTNVRKRIIITTTPILLASVTAGLFITNNSEKNSQTNISTWLLIIVVVGCILFYSIFKAIKQQKIIYDSYCLTIETDYLKQERKGSPSITLFFNEITEITKDRTGNLTLRGQKASSKIVISSFIENYDQVENLIRSKYEILQGNTKALSQKLLFLLPFITVVLFIVVYTSNNKILVSISGTIIIILLIWSFYKIRTSTQIDRAIKSKAWWVLLVLASIIAIIYVKVFVS